MTATNHSTRDTRLYVNHHQCSLVTPSRVSTICVSAGDKVHVKSAFTDHHHHNHHHHHQNNHHQSLKMNTQPTSSSSHDSNNAFTDSFRIKLNCPTTELYKPPDDKAQQPTTLTVLKCDQPYRLELSRVGPKFLPDKYLKVIVRVDFYCSALNLKRIERIKHWLLSHHPNESLFELKLNSGYEQVQSVTYERDKHRYRFMWLMEKSGAIEFDLKMLCNSSQFSNDGQATALKLVVELCTLIKHPFTWTDRTILVQEWPIRVAPADLKPLVQFRRISSKEVQNAVTLDYDDNECHGKRLREQRSSPEIEEVVYTAPGWLNPEIKEEEDEDGDKEHEIEVIELDDDDDELKIKIEEPESPESVILLDPVDQKEVEEEDAETAKINQIIRSFNLEHHYKPQPKPPQNDQFQEQKQHQQLGQQHQQPGQPMRLQQRPNRVIYLKSPDVNYYYRMELDTNCEKMFKFKLLTVLDLTRHVYIEEVLLERPTHDMLASFSSVLIRRIRDDSTFEFNVVGQRIVLKQISGEML